MSNIPVVSPNKEKKRPSVSSKCLLNIKSIVIQNVSLNNNNKNVSIRSSASTLPPLPLESPKESIDRLEIEEKKANKIQLIPNRNILNEVLHKSLDKKISITK
jgi:hypothetical protein